MDVVIVTDDGSSDPTGDYAAASGAIVVTHQRGRGRAAAIESGVNALGVLEQRDKRPECGTVLVLDADLGASAARAQHLIGPVVTERADLTIAIPTRRTAGTPDPGFDLVETTAARGIAELAGWTPRAPLATNRCLTRRAYELASPLAAGDGADVGMTIDLLRAGLRVRRSRSTLDGRRRRVRAGRPAGPGAGAEGRHPGADRPRTGPARPRRAASSPAGSPG